MKSIFIKNVIICLCGCWMTMFSQLSAHVHDGQTKVGRKTTISLYGLKTEPEATIVKCRTIPFLAAPESKWNGTVRKFSGHEETVPVGTVAKTLFLSGMINTWDNGVAHWGEHPELLENRSDQIFIGSRLGDIVIEYETGDTDVIPVITGLTAWFFNQWKFPSHGAGTVIREPFASRPEFMTVLRNTLKVKEEGEFMTPDNRYKAYFLAVTPRPLTINNIVIRSNPEIRGKILVSGITLELPKGIKPSLHLHSFGKQTVDVIDATPAFATEHFPDYEASLRSLSDILYNSVEDLPDKVAYPVVSPDFHGAQIRFLSNRPEGAMLSNIWIENLKNIDEKFEKKTGFFYETGEKSPFYGGYSGIGTWDAVGIYRQAYGRTADHYVRQALKCLEDNERTTNFVDFCDKWLYFYRSDHNPANGPDNKIFLTGDVEFEAEKYPADAPPHWSFLVYPPQYSPGLEINEIPGSEEIEAHASIMVNRWYAWKLLGKPVDEWMTSLRDSVYHKSRWQSTRDAADFLCWWMDYTGMDVIFSEGEFTGWSGGRSQIPPNMSKETDLQKIRSNYANSDMYEVYASYSSMTALQCSADMAEATGNKALADKYRSYAARIHSAMIRLLAIGPNHNRMWRVARNSVLPSLQDCLIQTWFGLYREGLDPLKTDKEMTAISRNTLRRQLNQRYGYAPVLAMGYGIGWLTHSALVLDQMDDAEHLLMNIARYTYDKNMDYADTKRKIDWHKWLWIIPEGVNILPDGRWYRICDLSNGANQGPVMNALEICAGIDDSKEHHLRLLPRIIDGMTGIEVNNFNVMTIKDGKNVNVSINYQYLRGKSFYMNSQKSLPLVDIRFGPYENEQQAQSVIKAAAVKDISVRAEISGVYHDKPAYWVWLEGIHDLSEFSLEVEGL